MAQDAVNYKIVVIGGSAGSLEIILKIVAALPENTMASFVIVVHRKNSYDSVFTDLLSAKTHMKVKEVEDKEVIFKNTIYVAPCDYHLLIEDERTFSLDGSEKVVFSRPSIDVTFESVAEIFGGFAVGVLLSGANADGSEGLKKIKERGGYTIAENPASAEVGFMPASAINNNAVTTIEDGEQIPALILKLLK